MKLAHRDYSEEAGDFARLCRFVIEHNATVRSRSTWCLGRVVDWKYGIYPNKRVYASFCEENAHLWFDAFGGLVGFAICENGDAGFAILTLPGFRFAYDDMLAWAMERWGARGPALSTEITERQGYEAARLEAQGFRKQSEFFTRRFDLTRTLPARFPLEPGFTIVDMRAQPEYFEQHRLRANAFRGLPSLSAAQMEAEMRLADYGRLSPIYHPDTDLCVVAPDGRFVSGCEALIDGHNAEADIERVCTHGDFRQRGFARAVIQECLYRLRDMGLRSAYITGYSEAAVALYGSLGAVDTSCSYVYQRPAA